MPPDRPAPPDSYAIRQLKASELRLIAAIDRSEELEHEYLCTPTRDGLGLRLVRQTIHPPRPIPTWSPSNLEAHLSAWHQTLQAGALLWGGFRGGALAGFILLQLHPSQAWGTIDSLCVDVRHRSRGLGAALLHQAESYCHASGCSALVLSTGYSAPAVDFYLRHGFRIVGLQDPRFAPRGAALMLAKELHGGSDDGTHRQPPATSRAWEEGL